LPPWFSFHTVSTQIATWWFVTWAACMQSPLMLLG
jgi:hypothetical protein